MIEKPFLLFLGDVQDNLAAKTAQGIVDWRQKWCLGQLRMKGCKADCKIKDLNIKQANKQGAKTMIIGVVNPGGKIAENWMPIIIEALENGLNIASGLHIKLEEIQIIRETAQKYNRKLHNVRFSEHMFKVGNGEKRSGKRLLTVGTDCSVGKKYTALAIEKEMRIRNINADFRATGQTGILIAERGVAIDAVKADFISGAAEWISPENKPKHWDIIEGQGSLFHPSFAGVSLGLLHGAQPDAIVICHTPGRKNMRGVKHPLPSIKDTIQNNLQQGARTNPDIQCVGIALNTQNMDAQKAKEYIKQIQLEYQIPTTDPIRYGTKNIVDEIQKRFP